MSPSLWHIEASLASALDEIAEADAAGADPPPEALALAEHYTLAAAEKRDAMAAFLRHVESTESEIDAEIQRLKARRDAMARARERLQRYIVDVMLAHDMTRADGVLSKFRVAQNPPHVVVDAEYKIGTGNAEHVRVVPERYEWDRAAIRRDLLAGKKLPYAWLAEGGHRLVVK